MFGIKIISKSEYEFLLSEAAKVTSNNAVSIADYEKLKEDCKSLREQLNEKIKENKKLEETIAISGSEGKLKAEVRSLREFKRDTLEAMGQIDLAGFRLSYCTKKCSKCENQGLDCKKYQFGTHEYCVIPK
jgi:hypothetical protein